MLKFISKFISIALHPVFMPVIGTAIIFHSGTYLSIMDKNLIRIIYLLVGLLTCVLPLSLIPVFIQTNIIRSTEMNGRRERVIPYFVTFVLYYSAYLLLSKIRVNYYFSVYLFSASMLVFSLFVISYFWKVSSHMAGIGGLIGLILSLSFEFKSDLMIYLVIVIFLGGILGSARLKLNSHSPAQIFAGFSLGLIIVFGVIHLLYRVPL